FARAAASADVVTADVVLACMGVLNRVEADALSLRYGVGGQRRLDAEEVGERLRISEVDVGLHECSALERLGKPDVSAVLSALAGSGVREWESIRVSEAPAPALRRAGSGARTGR